MTCKHIGYDLAGRILTITLDRPEALNAWTYPMLQEFHDALRRGNEDDEVGAVIVTGSGRAFSAGSDLSTIHTPQSREAARGFYPPSGIHRDAGGAISLRIFDYDKPIIAAINGPAAGYGATMTLPMDARICATTARFGFVFTRRGLMPEACATWFLPRLVGIAKALEWVQHGHVFGAEEALAAGLVREVVEPEALLPRARAIAEDLLANGAPLSHAMTRRLMWQMLGADHPMIANRLESKAVEFLLDTADAREAIDAFLTKRQPRYTMRPARDLPADFPWRDSPTFD